MPSQKEAPGSGLPRIESMARSHFLAEGALQSLILLQGTAAFLAASCGPLIVREAERQLPCENYLGFLEECLGLIILASRRGAAHRD